ncbi:MAG: hypothetical protein EHM47_02335, partial [Ignavibacteriales bacterium]
MKKYFLVIFISLTLFFSGCLTFHRISYKLNLEGEIEGHCKITIYDIRSDAEGENEFEEDKNTLFEYILASDTFLSDMMEEGKDITSRNLFVEENLLNGEVEFNFDDIRNVEGIEFHDGFYYLTMDLQDSIYSTNGEIIFSDDYKRIVWGKDTETIEFEMIATDYDDMYYRNLAPFYK